MSQGIQPGLDSRTIRAVAEYHSVIEVARGLFEVVSQSGKSYTVDLAEPACTCKDFEYRSEYLGDKGCKHIRRVRLEVGQIDVARLDDQLTETTKDLQRDITQLEKRAEELETRANDLLQARSRLREVGRYA